VRTIFLLGPTRSGKRAQANWIAERTVAIQVSNGDLVCAEIKSDSDLGKGGPATPASASLRIGEFSNIRRLRRISLESYGKCPTLNSELVRCCQRARVPKCGRQAPIRRSYWNKLNKYLIYCEIDATVLYMLQVRQQESKRGDIWFEI
jgi:hypothetical protein